MGTAVIVAERYHPNRPSAHRAGAGWPSTAASGQSARPTVSVPAVQMPKSQGRRGAGGTVIQGTFIAGRPRLALQPAMRLGAPVVAQQASAVPPPVAPIQPTTRRETAFPLHRLPPSGPGQPLPPEIQAKMEAAFQTDFSDVRIHTGPQAPSIGALAYTQGSSIYFAPAQYSPMTYHGQQLLGHELTHVLQQRAGRVRNPFGSGVAVVQDPVLETEADRMGLRAVALGLRKSAQIRASIANRDNVQSQVQASGYRKELQDKLLGKHPGAVALNQSGAVQGQTSGVPSRTAYVQPMFYEGPTLEQMIEKAQTETMLAETKRTLEAVRIQHNQNPVQYSDDKGHTITCAKPLSGEQRIQIFRYVSRMEDAIAMNEVLRGATVNRANLREDANTIIKAIHECGLITTTPMVLWRKAGDHQAGRQSTIISTTNESSIATKWGGRYLYMITVPAGEPYIIVRHRLIDGNFDEYLLPPGYFGYSYETLTFIDATYSTSEAKSKYTYDPVGFDFSGRTPKLVLKEKKMF